MSHTCADELYLAQRGCKSGRRRRLLNPNGLKEQVTRVTFFHLISSLGKHLTSPLFNARADTFGTDQDLLFLAYNEFLCIARFQASASFKRLRPTTNELNMRSTGSSPD